MTRADTQNGAHALFLMFELDGERYALDAANGKELWSSGNQVTSFAHNGALSIANGRVYFTTYDNTLYCFGFPMEH